MIAEPPPTKPPRTSRLPWAERKPRRRRRELRRGSRCLNCDTETGARFCPECGQENVDINISIWEIFAEAIQEFAQLDSKFVRTLVPLITKPGKLTKEWAKGRRVRYVSPLRLYLTITAGFFLLLSLLGTSPFQRKQAVPIQAPTNASRMENKLPGPLRFVMHQLDKVDRVNGRQLGQEFMSELPTSIFIMLPFYAGVVWVLYCRNRRYYVEHLVFALHVHAFYFIALSLMELMPSTVGFTFWTVGKIAVWICMPVYSILALKNNYGQGWIKTLVKSAMLGYAYAVLLAVAIFGSLIAAAASIPDAEAGLAPLSSSQAAPPATR